MLALNGFIEHELKEQIVAHLDLFTIADFPANHLEVWVFREAGENS